MGVSTFNAKEFNSIYTMIEDNSSRISSKSNQIVSLCNQLSQIIKSGDSNLASSYVKVGEAFSVAKNKIINLLRQLEEELKIYETKTVTNEEETDTKIQEINANLENIASIFNNIAGNNE